MHTAQGQVFGLEREKAKKPMQDAWKRLHSRQSH
jgi:hypothetical protein